MTETDRQRPAPVAGVPVVAGDTGARIARGIVDLCRAVPQLTRLFGVAAEDHGVLGAIHATASGRARAAAPGLGIDSVEDEIAVIGGARRLNGMPWTDCRLCGELHRSVGTTFALGDSNDLWMIAWRHGPARQRFRPEEGALRHAASCAFLAAAPTRPVRGPTVAVAPQDPLSAGSASDVTEPIVSDGPKLQAFGHTHQPAEFTVARTRFVAAPHGYSDEGGAASDPIRIIDIPRAPPREDRP